ncbi:MAG: hypothetical protein LH609_20680 [Rudanella sp.]|nr:hypothetical protein [Rudanella sp.]
MRLWVGDSTVQLLPDNAQTQLMGVQENQFKSVASIKLSVYFDVLTKLIIRVAGEGGAEYRRNGSTYKAIICRV